MKISGKNNRVEPSDTTKFEPEIRRHSTFRTDVSDNNQSTECRQQNISSDVDYPTHWSQNFDAYSGGYPTHLCLIGIRCSTPLVAVIRHLNVGSSMSVNPKKIKVYMI